MSAKQTDPSPEAIREQLERLVSSPDFARSEHLTQFLTFIVEETLAGRSDDIKGYTIGTAVLGRDDQFDPTIDPVVRIQAGRLRRALERYYLVEGTNDPLRIEVPKGGYRPTFCLIKEPELEVRVEEPFVEDPTEVLSRGPTIAVLPFTNLSGDKEQEYFAAGLTEELIVQLTRLQEVVVITHQSTRQYHNQPIDPRLVGRTLGTRFLLEGSVRKDSKAIRVAVRLRETENGESLWAQNYDRELAVGNIFDLQDDITEHVVTMIGDAYGLIPRTLCKETRGKPIENLNVYEATLRFYYFRTTASRESHTEAHKALEKAVELDPEYSQAWAMLGESYGAAYIHGFSAVKSPLKRAISCAGRAVTIDPMCQNARWAMAFAHFLSQDRERYLREAEMVISLNPNSAYMMGLVGNAMALLGEWDRGLGILNRVIDLNPYNPGWFHLAPYLDHYHHRRYEEALATAEKFNLPESFWDPMLRASVLGQLGQHKQAKEALEKALSLKPDCGKNLNRVIHSNEIVDHVIDGLRKAGLTR